MQTRILITLAASAALFLTPNLSRAATSQACAAQPDQPNTKTEILKIEKEWTQAYWTGHTDYLECLYAPDFVSIASDGKPHGRAEDIASSLKNAGKQSKPANQPSKHAAKPATPTWVTQLLMRPGYAIATSVADNVQHGLRVTDIYAYDGHHWHAIFSQDTKF